MIAPAEAEDPCSVGGHCCCCGPGEACCDCGEVMPQYPTDDNDNEDDEQ